MVLFFVGLLPGGLPSVSSTQVLKAWNEDLGLVERGSQGRSVTWGLKGFKFT
jgi:hypothetical protein